jgi:uncharacterized DUF497 family protein
MNEGSFEWDGTKAKRNYAKHGVSFEFAREVFRDVFAIERVDDRFSYEEERFVIVGVVEGVLLSVNYVTRNERLRLISARRATRNEQDDYFAQNQQPTSTNDS